MNLEKALKTIRKECKKHAYCKDCPLHIGYENCAVQNDRPERWSLICDDTTDSDLLFNTEDD